MGSVELDWVEQYVAATEALERVRVDCSFPDILDDIITDHLDWLWRRCLSEDDQDKVRKRLPPS